jgi:hypothetical protein
MGTTQLIQEVINDKNGEFVFDCEFVEGFGSGKNNLVAGKDRLEFGMHKRCLNRMNGLELGYNA